MSLLAARSLDSKNTLIDSWVIFAPAVILTTLVACFAPALLVVPIGLAAFAYFWRHKDKLVLFLLVYLPFEELVLKILPDNLYAPVRYMWEGLLFAMIALMLFENAVLAKNWKKNGVDKFFLFFLAAWVLSAFVNSIPILSSLAHIKNLIRYVPIFYIIYNLKPSEEFLKKVLLIIISIGVLESLICIGQAVEGDIMVKIFRPREVVVGGALIRNPDPQFGSYYTRFTGTFVRSNELGYYLAFVVCLIAARYYKMGKKSSYLLALVPVLAALVLSSSKISWISTYIAAGVIIAKVNRRFLRAYVIIPLLLIIVLITGSAALDTDDLIDDFNIISRFNYMFTSDYMDIVGSAGRLYAIIGVAPAVFAANPILGVGPGSFMRISAQMSEEEVYGIGDVLNLESQALKYVHDVGYVALFAQSGLIGLLAMILVFVTVYKKASAALVKEGNQIIQAFWLGAIGIIIAQAILNLASFDLMYRNQSLLIWTVCGLVMLFSDENKN